MELVDTHAHIYYTDYKKDFSEMLERAQAAGVQQMIAIATDLPSAEQCINLADKYAPIFATVGIHPHEARLAPPNYLIRLEEFSTHPKVVGIGEIGLDYHYNYSEPPVQIKRFREQLEMSLSLELPAVIHNRESDEDMVKQLTLSENRNAVLHSFCGSDELAQTLMEMEYMLSFTGMITFLKDLREMVASVPLSQVMIETDAPYLTPKPYRGKRNEPAYVQYVAAELASIHNVDIEEVASITTANARRFFPRLSME